jgi:hypothetical protein
MRFILAKSSRTTSAAEPLQKTDDFKIPAKRRHLWFADLFCCQRPQTIQVAVNDLIPNSSERKSRFRRRRPSASRIWFQNVAA